MFNDVFNENIKKMEMKFQENIKPNKMIAYAFTIDYNPILPSDINLLNTETGNIHFEFIPGLILFTDGSSKGTELNN